MAEKVKEVAIGEAERIKSLTTDAARSGAYLYPLRVRIPLLPQPACLGTQWSWFKHAVSVSHRFSLTIAFTRAYTTF